jgi:F-BAR and double SH3 domains protein
MINMLSFQLNTRREACEVKSTAARNDYLLSLAAANAHVQRYYVSDTPELMKVARLFSLMFA